MTNYNIAITSDVICPWCYIGHTRLSKAIAQHKKTYPEDKFHLRYIPFYLISQPLALSHHHFPSNLAPGSTCI
jgi:predicted DsbA family dithiol-disulfide isomerase